MFSDTTSFPVIESPSSSTRSRSNDWKNLGAHVDMNYSQSKLFRDSSSSSGSGTNEALSKQAQAQQPTESVTQSGKTNWGDFFFAQMQCGVDSLGPSTLPASVVVSPSTDKLPLQKPARTNKSKKVAHKSDKRYIDNPTLTDILMGRGGKSNHHPGNKRYREEILNFKKTYAQLTSKEDKTGLSRNVVDYVHKYKGRFLALDKTMNPPRWYEITDAVARRKVSQALREDVDPLKRQQKRARFLERKRQKEEQARGSV